MLKGGFITPHFLWFWFLFLFLVLFRQPQLLHCLGFDGALYGVIVRELFLWGVGFLMIYVLGFEWQQLLGHHCSDLVLTTSWQLTAMATTMLANMVGGCGKLIGIVTFMFSVVCSQVYSIASWISLTLSSLIELATPALCYL